MGRSRLKTMKEKSRIDWNLKTLDNECKCMNRERERYREIGREREREKECVCVCVVCVCVIGMSETRHKAQSERWC